MKERSVVPFRPPLLSPRLSRAGSVAGLDTSRSSHDGCPTTAAAPGMLHLKYFFAPCPHTCLTPRQPIARSYALRPTPMLLAPHLPLISSFLCGPIRCPGCVTRGAQEPLLCCFAHDNFFNKVSLRITSVTLFLPLYFTPLFEGTFSLTLTHRVLLLYLQIESFS